MQTQATARRTRAWYGVVGLATMALGYILVMIVRYAPAVIAPEVARDFSVGSVELGLMASGALWGYAAMTLVSGMLADSLGPRRAVVTISILVIVGGALFANSVNFPMVLVGRILMGIGGGIIYVSTLKLVAQWFGSGRFGTLSTLLVTVGNIGALLAAAPLAFVVGIAGWRSTFNVFTLISALFVLLVFLLVKDSPEAAQRRVHDATAKTEREPGLTGLRGLKVVLGNRMLWLVSLCSFSVQAAVSAVQGLWAVPYMVDVYGLPKQEASNILSLWALAIVITCPLFGHLSDKVLRVRKPFLLGSAGLMAVTMLVLIVFTAQLSVPALYGVMLMGGIANAMGILGFAFVNDHIPKYVLGTALGVYNFSVFSGGALSQQISGSLLSLFPPLPGTQGTVTGYQAVFIYCLVMVCIAGCAAAALRERREAVD